VIATKTNHDYPAPPVTGYNSLNQAQVDLMNRIKAQEGEIATVLSAMLVQSQGTADARWLDLARDHLETGFMYACKAVARPKGGLGDMT
jgi:hypothetical protein